ncbi:hypothetical protein Lalb_Chr22g0360451 [Lupinus albus]|uniref:Uncharacterized protein n=1 Tax=Lupinus albus TaxID=3870 RepID=A0A6A4NQM0_LUPAL|nr:hypothetical protein Lalb_Chr22g0360451 [Lupinus albus]
MKEGGTTQCTTLARKWCMGKVDVCSLCQSHSHLICDSLWYRCGYVVRVTLSC